MLDELSVPVVLSVKEWYDNDKSKLIGNVSINLLQICPNERIEDWYPLTLHNAVGKGLLKLVITLSPLGSLPGNYSRLSRKLPSFRLEINQSSVDCGSFIEGSVILLTRKPVDLKRIYLRVLGMETVSWTEEDWEQDRHFTGETTLVNKWYHGWENTQETIDAGYYNWKYRIKISEGIPPSYESSSGKITYHVFGYLDHTKSTEGHPLTIFAPIVQTHPQELYQHKHNMQVSFALDKPVYYQEDCPIKLLIVTCIKNYSDYKIKAVKVQINEKTTFSANNNVSSEQKILFKQTYRSMNIAGHQQWEGKLLADLPAEYKNLTITRSIGATRISCVQTINITVIKDTPLHGNRVHMDMPLLITTKPITPIEGKKQLISLRRDALVTTPPSPMTSSANIPIQKLKNFHIVGMKEEKQSSPPEVELLLDFQSPLLHTVNPMVGQGGMAGSGLAGLNLNAPWNAGPPINPFAKIDSPRTVGGMSVGANPFLVSPQVQVGGGLSPRPTTQGGLSPRPTTQGGLSPRATTLGGSTGTYPLDKNPFL